MGWDRKIELVLVICHDQAVANNYMAEQPKSKERFYAWAPRWSCVVGRNPANTSFVCVGEWWLSEECERAYYWLKDRGFREIYPA
jgi:hypothetical protein